MYTFSNVTMLRCYNVTMYQCYNDFHPKFFTLHFFTLLAKPYFALDCLLFVCLFVLVSVVLLYVLFKIVILCETLLADIALKVLYTAMDLHVLSQIAFIG